MTYADDKSGAGPAPAAARPAGATPQERFKRVELKFVLSHEEADRVRTFADGRLAVDPFAGSTGAYLVHSLYFDTPSMDVYHRTADVKGVKYRIRRYADENVVWLERKRRREFLVTKRRGSWPLDALASVLEPRRSHSDWPGEFRRELDRLRLEPRLLVSYMRSAWNGGGDARLTLDWGVMARTPDRRAPFLTEKPGVSASRDVVLELKYGDVRPATFDEIVRVLGRDAGSFSKYGRGAEAAGLVIRASMPERNGGDEGPRER